MSSKKVPKTVFIIPYRNRKEQMFFFSKYMGLLLKDDNTFEFYFSHQHDQKPFSRGATKNIGFLVIKSKYPEHYKGINFVFNDVDTIPYNNIFSYTTNEGVVCHYYGFTHSLGGIVVIKGSDFEKINGYPCLYTWGREDYVLQNRCEEHNLYIDRSNFYPIGAPEILQLFDGVSRIVNSDEIKRTEYYDPEDGVSTLFNLYYTIDNKSKNEIDDGFLVETDKTFVINILNFTTKYSYNVKDFRLYDLRNSEKDVMNKNNKQIDTFIENNSSWTNIPKKTTMKDKMMMLSNNKDFIKQHQLQQSGNNSLVHPHVALFTTRRSSGPSRPPRVSKQGSHLFYS